MKETEGREKWEEGGERGIQEKKRGLEVCNNARKLPTIYFQVVAHLLAHVNPFTKPSKTAHTENGLPHLPSSNHEKMTGMYTNFQ